MKQLAENLWVKNYPLAQLGTDLGRNANDHSLVIRPARPSFDGAVLFD
jgi:hypothetical protein